jgi:hypothetical protein
MKSLKSEHLFRDFLGPSDYSESYSLETTKGV